MALATLGMKEQLVELYKESQYMKENLLLTFFLCIFAKWIGGSHEPSTRVIQQPFHFAYLLELLNVGKNGKINARRSRKKALRQMG